ncbi:MAG: aminotransferase class I/II-fold pyridoxal phosphate-dependent enzyme [Acidobacteriota bacterium]|nr:aminotransferase class I/II-fold pyridoxal phosphate-dependent enzyme [Acidobacteriota bacterium]
MSTNSFNRREMLKVGAMASAAFLNFNLLETDLAQAQTVTAGKSVIKLSGNENPYGPSPKARKAIIEAVGASNRYPWNDVLTLEKMIAEREGLQPENVVLGAGSSEILVMAGIAYGLDKGEIVAADPTFPWLMRYAVYVGAKTVRVPLDKNHAHDLNAMHDKISANTKLVYVCNPNNPTGTIVPTGQLKQFCADAAKRTAVFVDEAYLEYTDEFPTNSMVDFVRQNANVIVSRTFSKIYGLAGLRIGYGLARKDIADNLKRLRASWLNAVSLRAAIASLQDADFVNESRRKNKEVRLFTTREMDKLNLAYVPSHCNSIWLNVGAGNRDLPAKLAKFNIQILGANNAPLQSDWARITIGTQEEMKIFSEAMRRTLRA